MRPRALLVALFLGLLVGGSSVARADSYPPSGVGVVAGTLSASSVADGGSVTLSGGGFKSGSALQLTLDGVVKGTTSAGSAGRFSAVFLVKGVGLHALAASGLEPDGRVRVVTASVTVTAAQGTGAGGGLPTTGAHVAMGLLGGLGLVVTGSTLILLARARRRHHLLLA